MKKSELFTTETLNTGQQSLPFRSFTKLSRQLVHKTSNYRYNLEFYQSSTHMRAQPQPMKHS